jgi:C4-dicarboxylate transporter
MRWLLLGALLGLLLLCPSLLMVVAAVVAVLLSKPVVVAFGLGLAVRLHLPRVRRWVR